MTRTEAKQMLISFGVAEPTDEQITTYLNSVNSESKKERDRADKFKADAERAADLQKQLDEINDKSLSDLELANKRIAELEKNNKRMMQMQSLAEIGIVGDNATKLINDDGILDYALLGTIIKERETTAAALKEKELLDKTPEPGGGKKNNDPDEPDDVKNAKLLNFGSKASSDAEKNYYKI